MKLIVLTKDPLKPDQKQIDPSILYIKVCEQKGERHDMNLLTKSLKMVATSVSNGRKILNIDCYHKDSANHLWRITFEK